MYLQITVDVSNHRFASSRTDALPIIYEQVNINGGNVNLLQAFNTGVVCSAEQPLPFVHRIELDPIR